MASDGGKGSTQRPTDAEAFSKGWEAVFGKKPSDELQRQYEQAIRLTSVRSGEQQAMNAAIPLERLMSGPHGLQPPSYYEKLLAKQKEEKK